MVDVVLGALVRDGRVLLALRSATKHAFPGVWDLPGGCAEPGETELDTLSRELHEELDVRVDTGATTHLCRLAAGEARLSAWLVRDWDGNPVNVAPEEHEDLRWCDLGELPDLAHDGVRAALDALK